MTKRYSDFDTRNPSKAKFFILKEPKLDNGLEYV